MACRLLFAVVAVVLVPAAAVRADITRVNTLSQVARLTGPGAINNTVAVGIGGTDLGIMVYHNGRVCFLFGDTFSGDTSAQGGNWRWNTMAWSSDMTPSDGVIFDGWITGTNGLAREVVHSGRQSPVTEIPTGAISVGSRLWVWYMSVHWWGPPGVWTVNYGGLAYTDNDGLSFTVLNDFAFPSSSNFCMVTASARDDRAPGEDPYVYVWGTPSGRAGGVKLARVLPAQIGSMAAYQYFGGFVNNAPTWLASEANAPLVVPAPVGEMSVMYNKAARVWTLMYFNQNRGAIEMRQARVPWGPWSSPLTITTASKYFGLYGSYMTPVYTEGNGQSVYFTMSIWDPYDVYLMRANFRVTVPADYDHDGDVDGADYGTFAGCFNGTGNPVDAACWAVDLNGDRSVDGVDFGEFAACFNGAGHPPACP